MIEIKIAIVAERFGVVGNTRTRRERPTRRETPDQIDLSGTLNARKKAG